MTHFSDGQYGYYEPGGTHRRLCEVQNGNVYFLDDNRVLKAKDWPGRFVKLVDEPQYAPPAWDKYPWANYAALSSWHGSTGTHFAWSYFEHEPEPDKRSGGYHHKRGKWCHGDGIIELVEIFDKRKTLTQRPAVVQANMDAAGHFEREPTPDEIAYGLELERELKQVPWTDEALAEHAVANKEFWESKHMPDKAKRT